MGFLLLSLLVAAVGHLSTVASQPLELAPRADELCSAGGVEFTDGVRDMFRGFTFNYCQDHKPGDEESWTAGNFWIKISSSADGCAAPASMPENECKEAFKKTIDACPPGSEISGGSSLWTGPDGTCLKFSTHAEPIEVLKTDIVAHEEINEVDVGEGLYSCDDYMKLFDLAKEGCTPVGCVTENKACDDQTCVTIDGTTNQGVDDKFKGYLDQLRGVIAGSCKTEAYQDYYCTPNGVCSTNKRVKVQIPSFIGSSTSKDKGLFVANYKVTFTQKERKSACDIITALLSADPRVGAIVLTSSNQRNRMFCAGLDFNVPLTLSADRNDYREPAGKVALALYRCTKPVVAAINGSTICVGITMTLPANIRVVSRDAKVGFIFSRRGFSMEACSSFFLPRLVGSGRALHLTTTGSVYPATHQIFDGLFSDVVDPDEVLPTAFRYADEISSNVSGLLARVMKDMIYRNVGSPEETHLLESKIFYDLLKGSDSEEGVQSFMQKRKPDFKATMEKDAPSAWPWWTPVDIKIKERL